MSRPQAEAQLPSSIWKLMKNALAWLAIPCAYGLACADVDRRPASVAPSPGIAGISVGAACVRGRCTEGLTCHYGGQPGAPQHRCVLESGRCRDSWDCASSVQRCRRFGERLGVCQDSGL